MIQPKNVTVHSAAASALGFYYQSFFALETLIVQTADDAAVAVERLDDVELSANGDTLLFQLKHTLSSAPPPITIKSKALWRTIKVWVDLLPNLTLADTTLHLVAVGSISEACPLQTLTSLGTDRSELVQALICEAERVLVARAEAYEVGKKLPYSDRVDGCEAFLSLTGTQKLNLLRRILIQQNNPTIVEIEGRVASLLTWVPEAKRPIVAKRLIEWWDREIVYSLCELRDRAISRIELQSQYMIIIGDLEDDKLWAEFETISPPEDYSPDGMLTRQINLVGGKPSDLVKAIREEWRAREQRSSWLNSNPAMASVINDYDLILSESWSDRHTQMAEDCADLLEDEKQDAGLKLLRWTHESAPTALRPIKESWVAPYYVRGSYQVLAINLNVGWHPNFAALLEEAE